MTLLLRGKRTRSYRESRYCSSTHLQPHTCQLSHAHIQGAHGWCSRTVWHGGNFEFYLSTCRNLRFKLWLAHVVRLTNSTELIALDVTLEEPPHGGCAGVRLGEAQNPEPAAHERDVAGEPCVRRTRINDAGDAAPGSQFSITRRVQNLQLTGTPPAQPTRTGRAPQPMPNSRRPTPPRSRHQRDNFRCARCGSDPEAYIGSTDSGLAQHMA